MPARRGTRGTTGRTTSEPDYRRAFRSAPIPAYIFDAKTHRILDVNDAAVTRYGWARAEFLRLTARTLRPPEDVAAFERYVAENGGDLARSGAVSAGVWRHRRRDGTVLDVDITWARLKFRGRDAFISYAVDVTERRRAERALADSLALLRTVVEHAPLTLFAVGPDGRFTLSEGTALRDVGLSPGEFVGRSAHELYGAMPFTLADGSVITGDDVIRRVLAGETIVATNQVGGVHFENYFVPLPAPDGSGTGLLGMAFNVTRRWLAEQSARRWALVVNAASDAVIIADNDGIVADLNPSAEALLGRTRAEVVGRPAGMWHAPGNPSVQEIMALARARGMWRGELRYLRPDGETRLVETTLTQVTAEAGDPIGVAGVIRDVTHTRRAETELREASQRLAAIVESSPLAMYTLDPDLVVGSWNRAAERMFGWTAAEAIGQVLPTLAAEDLVEARALVDRCRKGETLAAVELDRRRKDGTPIVISLSSAPLYGADAEFVGISSMALDVTERRKLEDQLRQAQRMESVGRLAGGIAHDFNNLITAILGSVDLVRAALGPGHEGLEDIGEIEKAARRAADLTRQLLAFSRQQMLAPSVVDPNALIHDVERMLQRVIGEDIRLEVRLDAAVGRVRVDPNQLAQVVMNLVVNARDAMPEGGVLTIRTTEKEFDGDYIETHAPAEPGRYVVIEVSDSGTGIPPDVLPRIFEPFFTTKGAGEGTGLGLSTVYGIVKQSGGYIWAYSEVGRGSTFKVYLPR
ncbi:MAG TPA: PAS domain S-box protein, partial [Gemmatimonadales bacterium]|nr:PAS domain S-box protein [Gemmatimonadales bacterium]